MPPTTRRLALLFDLDGTLIDSIGLLLDCMRDAFADRARRPTEGEWVAGIGTPLREQLAPWCHGPDDVERLVARYRDYQDRHLEATTAAYPGVPETIAWARAAGHALGVVTSKGRGMTARSLAHLGLADTFDTVITVEDTARHKPHPDPVELALARLAIPAPRRSSWATRRTTCTRDARRASPPRRRNGGPSTATSSPPPRPTTGSPPSPSSPASSRTSSADRRPPDR